MNDPEISAMSTIAAALDPLDEGVRDRIIRWARDRYGKAAPTRETLGNYRSAAVQGDILPREQGASFPTDIAEAYSLANPSTDAEKVLLVGYWYQAVKREAELDSQTLNTELKHLGYPVTNVTRAVGTLASTTPRYVVQTKKTGSTRQARKKFKLTVEGIKKVEQMLGVALPRIAQAAATDDLLDAAEQ